MAASRSGKRCEEFRYGREGIFKEFFTYLDTEKFETMLQTLIEFLEDNDTPDNILDAISRQLTPFNFVAGVMSKKEKIYIIIRSEMGNYDIDCRSELSSNSDVWKKILALVWTEQYQEFREVIKIRMQGTVTSPRPIDVEERGA